MQGKEGDKDSTKKPVICIEFFMGERCKELERIVRRFGG